MQYDEHVWAWMAIEKREGETFTSFLRRVRASVLEEAATMADEYASAAFSLAYKSACWNLRDRFRQMAEE